MASKLTYKIDKQLANGRYGNIYLAFGKNNEKVVIKKVDLIVLKKDDKILIQKEVDIQRDLISPYIVKIIESCTESGYQYIALEYCDGGDLSNLIHTYKAKRIHFSQHDILKWMYQILKGLKTIHQNLIIHRDIKPDNIILIKAPPDSYTCKISDFGLSWRLPTPSDTCTSFTGTPIYMAPEIILGNPYNHIVDIWSLGCVLVELCNLNQPYNDEDIHVVMNKILDDPIPTISNQYTQDVHLLVSQMLVKDAKLRPEASKILNNKLFIKYRIDDPEEKSNSRTSHIYRAENKPKANKYISSKAITKPNTYSKPVKSARAIISTPIKSIRRSASNIPHSATTTPKTVQIASRTISVPKNKNEILQAKKKVSPKAKKTVSMSFSRRVPSKTVDNNQQNAKIIKPSEPTTLSTVGKLLAPKKVAVGEYKPVVKSKAIVKSKSVLAVRPRTERKKSPNGFIISRPTYGMKLKPTQKYLFSNPKLNISKK